jgi:hypothetical protein
VLESEAETLRIHSHSLTAVSSSHKYSRYAMSPCTPFLPTFSCTPSYVSLASIFESILCRLVDLRSFIELEIVAIRQLTQNVYWSESRCTDHGSCGLFHKPNMDHHRPSVLCADWDTEICRERGLAYDCCHGK